MSDNIECRLELAFSNFKDVPPQGNDFISSVNHYLSLILNRTVTYVNILESTLYRNNDSKIDLPMMQPVQYSQLVIECIMLNVHLSDRVIYAKYGHEMRSNVLDSILPRIVEFIEDDTLTSKLPRFKGMCTYNEKLMASSFYQAQHNDNALPIDRTVRNIIFDYNEFSARSHEYWKFNLLDNFAESMYTLLAFFGKKVANCIYSQPEELIAKYIQVNALNLAVKLPL